MCGLKILLESRLLFLEFNILVCTNFKFELSLPMFNFKHQAVHIVSFKLTATLRDSAHLIIGAAIFWLPCLYPNDFYSSDFLLQRLKPNQTHRIPYRKRQTIVCRAS